MFEVAHDASRPFVVVAGDTRVQAIGTIFTVRRTRDDVVVTLIKGRVAVSHGGQAAAVPVVLRPGEKLTEPAGGSARIEPESVEAATAWRRGQTIFRDTPLGAAAAQQTTGSINGRVSDDSGALIPGVTVTLTSPVIQGQRSSFTDEAG